MFKVSFNNVRMATTNYIPPGTAGICILSKRSLIRKNTLLKSDSLHHILDLINKSSNIKDYNIVDELPGSTQ